MNPYCSRKNGATIKGKFYPHPYVSDILAAQIKRQMDKLAKRDDKRMG